LENYTWTLDSLSNVSRVSRRLKKYS